MKPYYQQDGITIFHADCREVLSEPPVVAGIVTDPPYPDYHIGLYNSEPCLLDVLDQFRCKQFVFWSASATFSLSFTAVHIWDKMNGVSSYERIFERHGDERYELFHAYFINSVVAAQLTQETYTGHPSQKPVRLLKLLLSRCPRGMVLDPFAGSGSTLVAAKQMGLESVGIEREERYCEIAAKRLSQGVLSEMFV